MLQQRTPGSARREFSREGTGGRITITAPTRQAAEKAALGVVESIDFMRGPHIACGPSQTDDGWSVTVVYFGLD